MFSDSLQSLEIENRRIFIERYISIEKFAFTLVLSISGNNFFLSTVSPSRAYFTITTLIPETVREARESRRHNHLSST